MVFVVYGVFYFVFDVFGDDDLVFIEGMIVGYKVVVEYVGVGREYNIFFKDMV